VLILKLKSVMLVLNRKVVQKIIDLLKQQFRDKIHHPTTCCWLQLTNEAIKLFLIL